MRTLILGLVFVVAIQARADAQVQDGPFVDGPLGAIGGLFGGHRYTPPDQSTRRLTVSFDTNGGYDSNETELPPNQPPDSSFIPQPSGYVNNNTLAAQFRSGRAERFIQLSGNGFANYHSEATRMIGGNGTFQLASDLGTANGVTGRLSASYEPTFLFNAFAPVNPPSGDTGVIDSGPAQGVTNQRWFAANGAAGFYHDWTPRQRTLAEYSSSFREPVSGTGYDTRTRLGTVRHSWNPRREFGLELTYLFNENRQTDPVGVVSPLQTQTATVAVRHLRRLSATRTYMLAAGVGAIRSVVQAGVGSEDTFTTPSYWGSANIDVSRSWSLTADANRSVATLEGLTPEPFIADALALSLDGTPGRRLRLFVSGSVANGRALISNTGSYQAWSGLTRVQYGVSSCCALVTSYSYYKYETRDVATIVAGFPANYLQQAVRVGMIFWLPLYGTF